MPERVAGVPLPESSGSYTRRHFFVVGIACVLSLQLGVGWSRILDRAMLVASLIALVLTSLGEAGYNGRVRQRRWFFVLGTGAAVVFSSWRAQRLGSLLHGSSFFLEHAAQLKQLECPVCISTMIPPIRQCQNGHTICDTCSKSVDKCVICRIDGRPTIRNLALEITSACRAI